jgi:hypothetical protein
MAVMGSDTLAHRREAVEEIEAYERREDENDVEHGVLLRSAPGAASRRRGR